MDRERLTRFGRGAPNKRMVLFEDLAAFRDAILADEPPTKPWVPQPLGTVDRHTKTDDPVGFLEKNAPVDPDPLSPEEEASVKRGLADTPDAVVAALRNPEEVTAKGQMVARETFRILAAAVRDLAKWGMLEDGKVCEDQEWATRVYATARAIQAMDE